MERQQEVRNIIIIFLLTIASFHPTSSSNESLYTFTTIIDTGSSGDQVTDYVWLHPLSTTTTIYQDSTTYLPLSTAVETQETLDSSETNVLSQYAQPSYHHNEYIDEDDEDDSEKSLDYVIPYSVHEEARDMPTRPKYVAPGVWAKPPPDKDIPLDFVPTKLHSQVRGTHTVKRLPQQEAIESAETDEERRNAHRLREVVTNSKVNTIYTEEGYEDSAYDHAGHVRDADFHEGFARKLHDRKKSGRDSLSGKQKKDKLGDLLLFDKYKEYDEDYQDHLKDGKLEDERDNTIGYGKSIWERSEIDPKLIVDNGIRKLEEDTEKNAEETESSSKIYQNAQESKLSNDVKVDSSESEESQDEDYLKKEENKLVKTKKKEPTISKETKQSRKLEQKDKLYPEHYETTLIPTDKTKTSLINVETSVSAESFVTNPSSPQVYSIDQTTTLHYIAPVDESTTSSYSQIFWDYFKPRQSLSTTEPSESSTLVANSTIVNLKSEERTPIALETIDSHDPFLRMKEETTESPFTFLDSFQPNVFLDNERIEFGPSSAQGRHLLEHNDNMDYVKSIIAESTVATFTSVQPLLLQSMPTLNPGDLGYSSATILDSTVSNSTPAVMTLNITKEAYSRIADYKENPFLGSIVNNSNINVTKNKMKYKVLVRPEPKKPVKSIAQSIDQLSDQLAPLSISQEDKYNKIRDKLNTNYNKILNYIKSKQRIQSPPEKKKITFPEDLTLMRPPTLQQITYSVFPTNYPSVVDRSSVSAESESRREANWKGSLQDQHRPQSVKLPYRFDPIAYIQPVYLSYHKNPLPATNLLPPPPPIANPYANHYNNRQNDYYLSYIGSKPQQRRDNAFRYFPVAPEANWRTRSRRKRSNEGEFCNGDRNCVDVKAATNNGVTNDGSEQQDKGIRINSFDRITDRPRRKSSSQRIIDTPIDVPDTRLASPTKLKGDESETLTSLADKNSTVADSERKNIEDTGETVIDDQKLAGKEPIVVQSEERHGRVNNTNVKTTLVKKKRNISQDERSERNLKRRVKKEDHEELLNESPKISEDVIDKEIAAHFNEKDNNETLSRNKGEGKVEIEVPAFDYVKELAEDSFVEPSTTTETAVDSKKYPFYDNKNVPSASALRYIVNPKIIPRKTPHGMEFYNSRNTYKQCEEVEPNLDEVLPEKEEPEPKEGPQDDLPRLQGLGDKLDCFKAKYFDENPLDNPLFGEKLVEDPTPPTELEPSKLASKILIFPEGNTEFTVTHRVSKKPERNDRQLRNRDRQHETHGSIRVNYKHDPQTGRGRNAYLHTVRGSRPPSERRRKNQRSRPKIFITTQSPKVYQTASYQNQVYEDVMGNIRNMANSYQVYEVTTLPPTQIQATAGSENTLKIANATSDSSKEKSTSLPDVINAMISNTKSSEIKGLVPPPKYLAPRHTNYKKHRLSNKSKMSIMRSPNLPRIIAHHHTIKINKRSINDTAKNSSKNINKGEKTTVRESIKAIDVKNNTIVKLIENTMKETNLTPIMLDLETKERRQINTQNQNLSTTLKIESKRRQRNSTNSDQKNEPSQKVIYTIRDRIRHSKPKWDEMRGFGKFSANPKTVDEDSRRKEPRYNHFGRKKKPVDDSRSNFTMLNSTKSASEIESATSPVEDGESGTTEVYRAEESVMHQTIYRGKDKYPIPDDEEYEESLSEEETTTNTYYVHEDVDEDVSATTKKPTESLKSKEALDLEEYLESDPPGYTKAFSEETTTVSSNYRGKTKYESKDHEKKQDEETDYPKNGANSWGDDSSEKAEEQVKAPMELERNGMETELTTQDDDSEELSSKEKKASDKGQTFFTYTRKPSSTERDKDDEDSKKTSFYRSFPFSRYKSKLKKEDDEEYSEEESEEKSEDYVFPWHADKEDEKDNRKWLKSYEKFEYPWEKRERLARERRRKQKRANRFRKMIFDDSDEDEEESMKRERPIYPWERSTYPWEKYNVPSKSHVNTRRDISRKNIDESKETNTEQVPLTSTKFSSKYSSGDITPTKPSSARDISRSITKFLKEDNIDESKEETSKEIEDRSSSFGHKSSFSDTSREKLVPDNTTQSPRKKQKKRRKIPQVSKDVSDNSPFDSKKEKSEDTHKGEEEDFVTNYFQLGKNNWNDSESQTVSSQSNQLSNSTKKVSSATGQRKKRRQRISKNNSTIAVDNASADSITESTKRRRRKLQVSTTSPSPSASDDLAASKSTLIPIRRRYLRTNEAEKINKTDSIEKINAAKTATASETSEADDLQTKTSTPKTRTIEHRSRVSKEKIVTKTTYPGEAENFNSIKMNTTSTRKDEVKKLETKSKRRKNNNKPDDNNKNSSDKDKLLKQKDEEGDYTKFVDEDEIKKLITLEKPQVESEKNPLNSFEVKQEEVKKINNFSAYDGVINDENDSNNDDFGMLSEIHAVNNLLQNMPSNRVRNDRANVRTETESSRISEDWKKRNSDEEVDEKEKDEEVDEREKDEDAKERRRLLLQAKSIKDPEHRLYFYIERK